MPSAAPTGAGSRPDGRTRAARAFKGALRDLIARAAIAPDDIPRLALARRAAGLISFADTIERRLNAGLPLSVKHSDAYVRATSSLSRLFRDLGIGTNDDAPPAAPPAPLDLAALAAKVGEESAAKIARVIALLAALPRPKIAPEDALDVALCGLSDAELLALADCYDVPREFTPRIAMARIFAGLTWDDRALGSGHGSDAMKAEGCRCALCCATDEERAAADAKAKAENEERERAWLADRTAKRAPAPPLPERVESDTARAARTKSIEAQQVKPLSPARNIAAEFDALAAFYNRHGGLSDR